MLVDWQNFTHIIDRCFFYLKEWLVNWVSSFTDWPIDDNDLLIDWLIDWLIHFIDA